MAKGKKKRKKAKDPRDKDPLEKRRRKSALAKANGKDKADKDNGGGAAKARSAAILPDDLGLKAGEDAGRRRRAGQKTLPIPRVADHPKNINDTDRDDDGLYLETYSQRHGTPPRSSLGMATHLAREIEGATGMPVVQPGAPKSDPWWKEIEPDRRRTYPYCAIGLMRSTYDSDTLPASAALVGRSLLVTAAHCLDHDTYGKARAIEFIPAFEDGEDEAPLGSWYANTATDIVAHPKWRPNAGGAVDWRYDIGIVRLQPQGEVLAGDACGYFVFDWPFTGKQIVEPYGYPEAPGHEVPISDLPELDGGDLVQSRGKFEGLHPAYGASAPIAVVSGFGSGASGGPWVTNIYPTDSNPPPTNAKTNCIVGVNSFIDPNYPTRMFSSQLVRAAKFLIDAVNRDRLDHPR